MSELYYKTLSGLIFVSVISWTLIFIYSAHASVADGTIDPNNVGNQNAWSDNAGWVNFGTGVGAGDIHITNAGITGYAWSQNYSWINMNPAGSGVAVAPNGDLSGSAWGENTGYIDFSTAFIDMNGLFGGTATGAVVGTINFNCVNCVVETDYRPQNFQGGGRRRVQDPVPEPLPGGDVLIDASVSHAAPSSVSDGSGQRDLSGGIGFLETKGSLLDLIEALRELFGWMYPADAQLVKKHRSEADSFQSLFLKRGFHRLIHQEYVSREQLPSYQFQYRLSEELSLEIVVDFMKSVFLNFGGACYDPSVLKFVEEIDFPGSAQWYERYVFVMKPWMDQFLGKSDYVLWENISDTDGLKALHEFLLHFCSGENPFRR